MNPIATRAGEPVGVSPRTWPTSNSGPGADATRLAVSNWGVVVVALTLLIGGGVVQGMITHRWQPIVRTNGPETRLAAIPLQLGEWDGKDGELSTAERSAAGVTHDLLRTYTNQATGDVVTVTLMCGPTGPIAVHPPTACYRGAGYQQAGETRSVRIESVTSEKKTGHVFAIADFYKPARSDQPQPRIYWAWSTNGHWVTPDSPRLEFASSPVLFKLYVTCERPFGSKPGPTPADEFLKLLLPEVQRIFISNGEPTGVSPRTSAIQQASAQRQ